MMKPEGVKTAQISRDRRRNDRRVTNANYGASASLITQVIIERQRSLGKPRLVRKPLNCAVDAYRSGGTVAIKRAPAGLSHRQDV